ncbi:MAG: glycosyltransferase family 2 protein [Planctomycetaceae bacterium]
MSTWTTNRTEDDDVRMFGPRVYIGDDKPADSGDGISFVIPAYNEQDAIASVVRETIEVLKQHASCHEVIVVDDCSRDRTAEEARAAGARVISHPYNRGYGNSLKTGITAAQYERVVICDADGSYPVRQLPRLLADSTRFDMIVGARTGHRFYGSIPKRIGRFCQLSLVNYVTGTKVPDANSGFRLFRRSLALRYFDFVCTGFSFTTSITIALICEQYAVKFVDIDYERRQGKSHVRYFRDTLRSLQIITHCILRYNPLKAFLLLAAAPFAIAPLPLMAGGFSAGAVAGAAACFCTSVIVFALGMLAYCVGGQSSSRAVDAGVYSWIAAESAAPKESKTEHREIAAQQKAA